LDEKQEERGLAFRTVGESKCWQTFGGIERDAGAGDSSILSGLNIQ
jgi:hypothetical protein